MTEEATTTFDAKISKLGDEIEAIRQAGSGVSAKIQCGEKPLGFVLFHDLFEFIQSQVVFRIW